MTIKTIPSWMEELEVSEVNFIKNFILAGGSLKKVAIKYGVTYPTVRLRLDKLINKIETQEGGQPTQFMKLIVELSLDDRIDAGTAEVLVNAYKKEKGLDI
ncbi:DUF2089 family protein [Emergencia sp.]|uniref:DUF2089 family protein n=1 Tax=Emergencia sp. TaxID=1926557 RepID=UPI003AEF2F7C